MNLLVNIDVDDLDRAVFFYSAAFDLRAARRLGDFCVEMLGAEAPIYLLQKAAGTVPAAGVSAGRDYRRHWTPVHLDFAVADIAAAATRAVAAGARLEGEVQSHVWGDIAHLSDPFGHGICLLQFRNDGYDEIAVTTP